MTKMRASTNVDLEEFKKTIQTARPEHREISQAMLVLILALEVGPNTDRSVEATEYPRDFVDAIVKRMHQAELWTDDVVDDREWWDVNENFIGVGLFAHAQVALGLKKRERTATGARYLDVKTGAVVHVWESTDVWDRPDRMH